MPRSMTGFARATTETPEFSLALSVKSVNHRMLDVQMRTAPELEPFDIAARRLIRQKLSRGHVQVNAQLEWRAAASVKIQQHLVEGYLAAYRQLARQHGIAAEPDLNAVLRLPGAVAWSQPDAAGVDGLEKALLETLERALDELIGARQREAEAAVAELERSSQAVESAVDRIAGLREDLAPRLAERLRQRLADLLQAAIPDPQRILQEAALLAERSDVGEEIQRLRQHNAQLRELLRAPGEVGKKLDFLLQEMNREANTILSKTSGIGEAGLAITDLGLAVKAEIEKIREQAMNLE